MFNKVLDEEKIDINPKDVIVFYTDGFVEAMNEKLEEYGEERLLALIKDNYDKSPKELLQIILKDVRKFMDVFPQHDDMTMVILKRTN
jgi:sigma-B regulation protein RsbU (phosphoserine phosphatase)